MQTDHMHEHDCSKLSIFFKLANSVFLTDSHPPVQYQNEAIHGGSQTLFYMENFIGQHLLLARCPFFHFGTEQRRLLEKKKTPCMS